MTAASTGPSANGPVRVLFVCTANICRSAYAEVRARQLLGAGGPVEVSSAGVYGFVDHPLEDEMAAQLAARGIDASAFRSRRLTMAMVDEADLVLTAEVLHRSFILDDRPAAFRKVFTLGQFDAVLAGLAGPGGPEDPGWPGEGLTGRELLAAAGAGLVPASAQDDVPDPYRRGPEAAASAAAHLDRLLEPALVRLAGVARAD